MKTNAKLDTIQKAVHEVSTEKYEGNVILRSKPDRVTKNVNRFTIKTKNRVGSGSLVSKDGKPLPRANADVHLDVIAKIFELEPKENIYVDTTQGRINIDVTDVPVKSAPVKSAQVKSETVKQAKRKYTHTRQYKLAKGLIKSKTDVKADDTNISIVKLIEMLQLSLSKANA